MDDKLISFEEKWDVFYCDFFSLTRRCAPTYIKQGERKIYRTLGTRSSLRRPVASIKKRIHQKNYKTTTPTLRLS